MFLSDFFHIGNCLFLYYSWFGVFMQDLNLGQAVPYGFKAGRAVWIWGRLWRMDLRIAVLYGFGAGRAVWICGKSCYMDLGQVVL